MYVTGSTGQGKSTQVPKLLLYGLEMIDYKKDGRVICTQPRIPPTIGNTEQIASQMGLPIKRYYDTYQKEIATDNFTLQFKYQGNNHENRNYSLPCEVVHYESLVLVLLYSFDKSLQSS